jgi:hypothetical protein
MSELRVLTDAELDAVSGGALMRKPTGGGVLQFAEEIVLGIFRALEGNPAPVAAK